MPPAPPGVLDRGPAAALARAKEYPYDLPGSCYTMACGRVLPLVRVAPRSALDCEILDGDTVQTVRSWARRRGVDPAVHGPPQLLLAFGSNASVAALSRKLSTCLRDAVIPVARATLADFEVVYSAHLSQYGAVPATLHLSPGARTSACVLMVSPAQRRLLGGTEPNYHLCELRDVDLRLDRGPALATVDAFTSSAVTARCASTAPR